MIVYPIERRKPNLLEKLVLKRFVRLPFFDNIVGKWTISRRIDPNFRESIISRASESVNRQRQIAEILINQFCRENDTKLRSLKEVYKLKPDLAVYNTEVSGPLHVSFSSLKNYVCSEFFGPQFKSGQIFDNRRHEDLTALSFTGNSFDIVISGDVLEHIPDPYQAHREIFRVLKSSGKHIFTVPFYQTEYKDEQRAYLDKNREVVHVLDPIYHADPIRPKDGILVYNIFALEMLTKLNEIGFRTSMHLLYRPTRGILGNNSIVFEAAKP